MVYVAHPHQVALEVTGECGNCRARSEATLAAAFLGVEVSLKTDVPHDLRVWRTLRTRDDSPNRPCRAVREQEEPEKK